MRVIIFRGHAGRWGWAFGYVQEDDYGEFFVGDYGVEKESIGQYTGLKDTNGIEIYEGDICLCDRNINDIVDQKEFVVNFESGAFFLERDNEIIYFYEVTESDNADIVEVIGNTYET